MRPISAINIKMNNFVVAALNRYFEMDEERAAGLNTIKGKLISLHIRELDKTLSLRVSQNHVVEETNSALQADVEISVSLKILPEFIIDDANGHLRTQPR